MSLSENLRDLERHADHFAQRTGFTYTVLDGGNVISCVYIYPSRAEPQVTEVRSWVRADRAELDEPLREAVSDWLATHWPFRKVRYRSGA